MYEICAHLPAPNIIHGFGFHASVTSLDDDLVSVMIPNEIPLSHSIAEWQYGRFCVDIYVQEGWKGLGDIVVFTEFVCVCRGLCVE